MIPEFDKMQIRRFKKVHLAKPRDLFSRFGERINIGQVPDDALINVQPNRKIDTYEAIKQEAYSRYADEQRKIMEAKERESTPPPSVDINE